MESSEKVDMFCLISQINYFILFISLEMKGFTTSDLFLHVILLLLLFI